MRKCGFTLTELLVTLGTIGVISAIMIPIFAEDVTKTKNATILGKVVAQFEAATAEYLMEETTSGGYVNKLSQIDSITQDNMFRADDGFGKYMGVKMINGNANVAIKNYYSSQSTNINAARFHFNKLPAEYLIKSRNRNQTLLSYDLYVDVNGFDNKPNCLGKDIFRFYLLDNGKMMPYGDLNGPAGDDKYHTTCRKNAIGNQNDAKAGASCTARVVADGYKITY